MIRIGESAVLLECGTPDGVFAALQALLLAPDPGVIDLVPGAETVLVVFADPLESEPAALRSAEALARDAGGCRPPRAAGLAAAVAGAGVPPSATPRGHEIPVAYDGPDLATVARHAGLTRDEVVALHSGGTYRVAFVGFQPGFAYLTGLDRRLHCPRLASPRPAVPAGSVAIGGEWTGVYPAASPGGWNLIGATSARLFDPATSPPSRLSPGDTVRFVPLATTPEAAR